MCQLGNGPLCIHEMLAEHDRELLSLTPNYRVNLIDPSILSDDDLQRFSSDLGLVLGYIKYAENKKELTRFVNEGLISLESAAERAGMSIEELQEKKNALA